MVTIDDIFAAMPDEAAAVSYEPLIIDPETRQVEVPESEAIFGVTDDGDAERKHFLCPRYVGDNLDLAGFFLRINWRNANSEIDSYLVEDLAASGDYVTFSWKLSSKVLQYKGRVQFVVCACMPAPGGKATIKWHTTLAYGDVLEGQEPDAAVVEAACSDVIAQLLALVESQSANVEAVGAAQVEKVQTEGTAQVNAVKAAAEAAQAAAVAEIAAKGVNTLSTIPEDYTAMGAAVDKLTRNTAGAIVCAAEGESIQVHDSSDNYLPGLRIFGRSTQDGTPTPDAPVEIVSTPAPVAMVYGKNLCPATAFSDMFRNGTANTYDATTCTITMDEDATTHSGRYCAPVKNLVPGELYTLSFDIRGTSGKIAKCGWDKENKDITLASTFKRYNFTLKAIISKEPIVFYANPAILGGLQAGEFMQFANVQIEAGGTATEYETYKTPQTLKITTPSNLPGIPVASGGNYTDANGQQWICDEVDLGRGVYVQRVEIVTYDGAGETWFKSTNGENNYLYHVSIKREKAPGGGVCFCNQLQRKTTAEIQADGNTLEQVGISPSPKYNVMYVNIGHYLTENTPEAMAAYLSEKPLIVQYALAEPTETPLDEATLAAFRELHSNKPTTTLLNDAGAWMAAEYVADTKLYIDRKLEAPVAANNA